VRCTEAGRSEDLLLDLLNSTRVVRDAEHDALGTAPSAREWMRERDILPTYSEWIGLMEARAILQAVVPKRAVADCAGAAPEPGAAAESGV
jgi:hypothetical protein